MPRVGWDHTWLLWVPFGSRRPGLALMFQIQAYATAGAEVVAIGARTLSGLKETVSLAWIRPWNQS